MENKYNCDAYDSGYCYCLGRPLTDEEDWICEDTGICMLSKEQLKQRINEVRQNQQK